MSYKPEDMVFTSLDQISLFTVKMIKRIVKVGFGVRVPKEGLVRQLIDVVEFNLNRLNIDRKWYFHAIRDYSRVFQNEWDNGVENDSLSSWKRFNNVLIVVALKLGIEKLWLLDGCNPFAECTISELASQLYPDGTPTFALKYLDQFDNLFYYLAKHSPSVENVRMPFSNNENVFECVRLR
ncbi:hypothetical protein SK128_012070 [Halocaridina rubra]|uniref:Uncharacterized protein n=1 Tax=Halocaridina rubra TaxID=373956 RepID=A0AAN9A2T3_HALRR